MRITGGSVLFSKQFAAKERASQWAACLQTWDDQTTTYWTRQGVSGFYHIFNPLVLRAIHRIRGPRRASQYLTGSPNAILGTGQESMKENAVSTYRVVFKVDFQQNAHQVRDHGHDDCYIKYYIFLMGNGTKDRKRYGVMASDGKC
jgi:hypothetical protein